MPPQSARSMDDLRASALAELVPRPLQALAGKLDESAASSEVANLALCGRRCDTNAEQGESQARILLAEDNTINVKVRPILS